LKALAASSFGVRPERPNSGDIGSLQRAKHGVFEEAAAEAFALPCNRRREAGQQHDRYGIAGEAFIRKGDAGLRIVSSVQLFDAERGHSELAALEHTRLLQEFRQSRSRPDGGGHRPRKAQGALGGDRGRAGVAVAAAREGHSV
jgi:hypothetical protein